MATVQKREWTTRSGKAREAWIVRYTDQHKKRHIETFTKRGEAVRRKTAIESEVERRTHVARSQSITVAEAGRMWVEQAESDGLENGTVRQYNQHLKWHIEPLLGRMKLADLSPADVHRFRSDLGKAHDFGENLKGRKPCSRAMIVKIMASLSSILSDMVAKNQVARNVVREATGASTKRQNRIRKREEKRLEVGIDIPTKSELRAILSAAQGKWRPIVVTAIFTGLRASELRGLRWSDVDLAVGILTVRQRADFANAIGDPKSAAGKREVPLAPIVINTLREWKLTCPKGSQDLVFSNGKGNVQAHKQILRSGLGPIEATAGLSDKARPKYGLHAFRHVAASLFIEQGFPPKRVQAIMGHSSITMTFDLYGHLFPSPEDDRKAMAELQARLVAG
jgi:integrase